MANYSCSRNIRQLYPALTGRKSLDASFPFSFNVKKENRNFKLIISVIPFLGKITRKLADVSQKAVVIP